MFRLKPLAALIALLYLMPPASSLSQERKIKPGDVIEIAVSQHEELNRSVVVSPEGKMDYPLLDGVPVDGITLSRLREILTTQLSRSLEERPLVLVRFTESYPITVTVLGYVVKPGTYEIRNTATIQSAIGEAGGFAPGAQLSQIKLIRQEGPRTDNHTVNMEMFYLKGELNALPALNEGDQIVVPGNPLTAAVKVLGSVEKPGSYEIVFRTSLLDVLALAGGPTADADLNKVKVIALAGQSSRESRINVNDLLQKQSLKNIPFVSPGDVVYVPKSKKTLGKFVGALRDLSAFATLYLLIRSERR